MLCFVVKHLINGYRMPVLQAPKESSDSSPEESIQQPIVEEQGWGGLLAIAANAQGHYRLQAPAWPLGQEANNFVQWENLNNARNLNGGNRSPLGIYDRDVEDMEEENHFPAYVHLLPMATAQPVPEPTIDELLRRVTLRTDLHNIETVRLRVLSSHLSLSHLSLFTPRLQHLDLNGSVLFSLRDLGLGLIHLLHLNVSNCGLNSLDGTIAFPSLRTLIANGNMIQRLGSLTDMPSLQYLSLCQNRISELSTLTFLSLSYHLTELDLRGNPVCRNGLYRLTMQRNIPSLQVLDGETISSDFNQRQNEAGPTTDSDDMSSLSNASISLPLHNSNESKNHEESINSAPVVMQRSSSESSSSRGSSLYAGSPVVGSVLSLARNSNRQRQPDANAWLSADNSSSSLTSSHDQAAGLSSSLSSQDSCDLNFIPLNDK
uniref:U2A'/phosphoprotein 32 family A C-terminal domain-containing protein n=1 Tax=Glossina brevipalpis TaxID=37001 RepID=A0A1A9W8G0_9MUSC